MHVRRVAATVDDSAFLGDAVFLGQLVVVAVKIVHVLRDHDAFGVVPRPGADAIACVHGWLTATGNRAEIGTPTHPCDPGGVGERLTVSISTGEPAEGCTVARP